MAGTEHCPHCDCGNPEDYERCMACGEHPTKATREPAGEKRCGGQCGGDCKRGSAGSKAEQGMKVVSQREA